MFGLERREASVCSADRRKKLLVSLVSNLRNIRGVRLTT